MFYVRFFFFVEIIKVERCYKRKKKLIISSLSRAIITGLSLFFYYYLSIIATSLSTRAHNLKKKINIVTRRTRFYLHKYYYSAVITTYYHVACELIRIFFHSDSSPHVCTVDRIVSVCSRFCCTVPRWAWKTPDVFRLYFFDFQLAICPWRLRNDDGEIYIREKWKTRTTSRPLRMPTTTTG